MSLMLQTLLWETSSSESSDDEFYENYLHYLRIKKKKLYLSKMIRFNKCDEHSFLERFRVSKKLARALVLYLEPKLKSPAAENTAITLMHQILIALEFYGCGSYQRCIANANTAGIAGNAGLNKSSISQIIHRVTEAIANMSSQLVSMPQNEEQMKTTATKFYELSALTKVIGVIGCTHVPIKSPGGLDVDIENCRNKKYIFSIKVQAVCDADLYVKDIVARWPGKTHNSHIFNNSVIKMKLDNGNLAEYRLLGDQGYAAKPYMLKPLRNPTTEAEIMYNECQSRTRNVVNRMFDSWRKRFPVLSMTKRMKLKQAPAIVVATTVLHNMCLKMKEPMPTERVNDNSSETTTDEE